MDGPFDVTGADAPFYLPQGDECAIFAAAHVSSWGLARPVSLLPLALVLGWLRWRTGRLWPGIALHGWSNLALVTYLLWPV